MIIGILALIFGILLSREDSFFKNAIMVKGEVTAYKKTSKWKGSKRGYRPVYYEIITFEIDGEKRTITDTWEKDTQPLIGARRQVGINPENKEDVQVYSGSTVLFGWICIIFGIICMCLGI